MISVNLTKEGIEVKPGQVWQDLEQQRRFGFDRKLSVVSVHDGRAVMCRIGESNQRTTTVAVRRMHKSATGWSLVSEAS